ncbi:hypothetical protein MCUN1_001941 [Malassezia cuniculi]|uniref:Triacylglycerol lipase n=1 Tax=Malassezia cuniculi TaxID=948313 RepID=A0AAF0EYM6_9BASI|nr:hypothetical protein MCUN1_001941 [Malassezia cuniculi]
MRARSLHELVGQPKQAKQMPHPAPGSQLEKLMNDPDLLTKNCTPRYPIVLCHGLYGFDVRGPFWGLEYHYWSTTLEVLRKQAKARVYVFAVPPTGSIAERAQSLHRFLCDPANGLKGQKINFIGHSMGGLDVRHLITAIKPDPSDYIPVSLTSLGTPHRGSPLMDWCNANIGVGVELRDNLLRKAGHVIEDTVQRPLSLKSPILKLKRSADNAMPQKDEEGGMSRLFNSLSAAFSSYMLNTFDQPAYAMLSTQYMNTLFNPTTPDDNRVRYFSVAARARNMAFWHPLWLPKLVMDKSEEMVTKGKPSEDSGNDGVVSVSSARWGTFLGVMEGWDHWDIRGPGGSNRVRQTHKINSTIELEEDPADEAEASDDHKETPLARGWLAINQTLAKLGVSPAQDSEYDDSSWDWLDAIRADDNQSSRDWLSAMFPDSDEPNSQSSHFGPIFPSSANDRYDDNNSVTEVAQKLAEWIASHLPQEKPKEEPAKQQNTVQRLLTGGKDRRINLWPSKWSLKIKSGEESPRGDVKSINGLAQRLAQPLTFVPVALSLQYITSSTLDNATALRVGEPAPLADVWDTDTFGRGRLPRIDDELLPLEWGQLQVLHTTDIHGWYQGHQKHSPPEPNYSGDWGDWVAFTQHMRKRADNDGVDLLFVDTGDLHDGNGLSDAFPSLPPEHPNYRFAVNGHVSNQVFALADYDVLTIGNHELYNYSVALDVYENFAPRWSGRYLTSNVNISLFEGDTRPIGSRYARFVTPNQNLRVQSYGVLFDFKLAAKGISVQDPVQMAQEPWFVESLHDGPVDVFVIAGHMPITGDNGGWDAVLGAIRKVHPTTPVLMFGGHTHVRDCRVPDAYSMALESGRYLETVGWMSVSDITGQPKFSRRYIDANPRNYAFHAHMGHAGNFGTERGRFVRSIMDAIAGAWNLTRFFGLAPQDYYLDRVPHGHEQSLLTLVQQHVLPEIVRPANPERAHEPSVILLNSGSQRFDVYAGAFTKNDQYVVSPFRDDFLYIADVPWGIARQLVHKLNSAGAEATEHAEHSEHAAQEGADTVFHRYLSFQWTSFWTKKLLKSVIANSTSASAATTGRPEQARRVEELLQQLRDDPTMVAPHSAFSKLGKLPSLGYVTIDGCPGQGDDTVHTPIPFSGEQPDYVAAEPSGISDDALVNVVFVDFILKPLVRLLNQADASRAYTAEDAKQWGNISTQWLYPLYAKHAWKRSVTDIQC